MKYQTVQESAFLGAASEKAGFIVLCKASLLASGFCNKDSLLKVHGTFLEYGCSAILAIASSDF